MQTEQKFDLLIFHGIFPETPAWLGQRFFPDGNLRQVESLWLPFLLLGKGEPRPDKGLSLNHNDATVP